MRADWEEKLRFLMRKNVVARRIIRRSLVRMVKQVYGQFLFPLKLRS